MEGEKNHKSSQPERRDDGRGDTPCEDADEQLSHENKNKNVKRHATWRQEGMGMGMGAPQNGWDESKQYY